MRAVCFERPVQRRSMRESFRKAGWVIMDPIRLFLCGDVMTGRGIDQILAHPCDPAIHEGYLDSALDYVRLAEETNGPIPRRVEPSYIWGDALEVLERFQPDVRVVNLETAVTISTDWLSKGINYRMNPANVDCLSAAHINCCGLANNHVFDWGAEGLLETLDTLRRAGIQTAGAGRSRAAAMAPAIFPLEGKGRVLVYALGMESSGVPVRWAAHPQGPGVDFLLDLSRHSAEWLARRVQSARRPGDIVVASLHWGPNWGYGIAPEEISFAHALVDSGMVDVVHGHSSHHPKGIEVYRDRLILYGCGDFINDYEGIHGNEEFRGSLGMMILPALEPGTGKLLRLQLVATQIKRFQVVRAPEADARWLCAVLNREGRDLDTSCCLAADNRLDVAWGADAAAARALFPPYDAGARYSSASPKSDMPSSR